MKLSDFVRVYDGVLPPSFCKELMTTFESSPHQRVVDNDFKPFFTELNLNQHYPEYRDRLVKYALYPMSHYCVELKEYAQFLKQERIAMEEFRVKRYNSETGEQFAEHVDACSLQSSKRSLAFLFYLNDDFTGGETFFNPDRTIQPKAGSVIIFPPTWQYPHAGLPLMTGTKYIMSTYLNFI